MSGGADEYTMSNIVSNDGITMMNGYSSKNNSGYTGEMYNNGKYTSYTGIDYPSSKYYDKYSFSKTATTIKRSKLGDGIKEVKKSDYYDWYRDDYSLAYSQFPWFSRGGRSSNRATAGLFQSGFGEGSSKEFYSSRLIITP